MITTIPYLESSYTDYSTPSEPMYTLKEVR